MKKILWTGVVIIVFMSLFTGLAAAAGSEHPVITAIPGFTARSEYTENRDFHQHEFWFADPESGEWKKQTVRGKYWYLYYEALDAEGNPNESISPVEIMENYKAAALEKGGKILLEDGNNGYLTFTIPGPDTAITWCYVEASTGSYSIYIIEEKNFEKKLNFSADHIRKELEARGKTTVQGILFDLDKATLKLESLTPLQEVVKALLADRNLNIEIQGHTDNQGSAEHNLKLSESRAGAVRDFLVLFGVDPQRLTAKGCGMSVPVASNDTEDGRARNRRVELVKR
ncbi:OmpA family protein [bacterium]|nr:OmpA family protein [candidate division CSSED10-310 bacterium]